ncbi:MAG: anaerobic ribonucleoside-triphosphate reductase, partial [Treponemataceae bacterium]|nr:anaerobic ribonucleoside-triphosphate reductase [Treponemataceae bacterium]
MKIIKRNGEEVQFNVEKIENAVRKANVTVPETERLSEEQIKKIGAEIQTLCENGGHEASVEEIQDFVETKIMEAGAFSIAKKYITYRYQHELNRKENSTDRQILSLLECNNEDVKQENSNKNSTVVSVQRDYMAGEVSKDITRRFLLDEDLVKAHEEGLIHFHDADYFAQHMHNCDLVNLEDMLQNGTVISGTKIDRPHSFSTACNIATQIIAQVASCQYGGQSISLTHLAPFVEVSRKKISKELRDIEQKTGIKYSDEQFDYIVRRRLGDEITRGVQTIQYQVVTL